MPLSILPNPYLMAVFAAVAIGIVVYEIVSKQKKVPSGRGPPTSGRGPIDPPTSGPKTKDPPTSGKGPEDSSTSPIGPKDPITSPTESRNYPNSSRETKDDSGYSDSKIRKRNIAPKPDSSKETVKKGLNETLPKKSKARSSDVDNLNNEGQKLSSNTYQQNVDKNNYEKNVYDKILNETKSVQNISKNISDEDSDSENNASEKINHFKICNMDVSDQPVYFSNGSNNLSQSSKEEEIYKKNISKNIKCQKAIKNEHVSQEKDGSADEEAMKDKNVLGSQNAGVSSINFNVTQEICSGCEEAPINTVAYPCGHSYLCAECAKIVFRIHKTCSMCLADIVKFEFRSM